MLEPHDRRLLLEALRPPPNYRLHRAIGTTFSLDLLMLLTVPLAFTLFDWQDSDGQPTKDPIALLDALRHHADRISIFCQSGQILVPRTHQTLYGYLEESVIEVNARNPDGIFHPKVWILRFEAGDEVDDSPVRYRVLVLSRNLTFDRSWDVALRLDGTLTDRRNAFGRNHPLGDFIQALPSLAQRPIPPALGSDLERIQDEVRRIDFELPPGVKNIKFWPIGHIRGQRWPFEGDMDRLLVISPFLTSSLLKKITQKGHDHVLISLPESLASLDIETRNRFASLKVLAEHANPEPDEPTDHGAVDPISLTEVGSEGSSFPLAGLHAKVYVVERGWNARVWVGSANATEMAFRGNVEFLVELAGSRAKSGVDSVLSQHDDTTTFADLLQDYHPSDVVPTTSLQQKIEKVLDDTRRSLARANFFIKVDELDESDQYRLTLCQPANTSVRIPKGMRIWIRPITLQDGFDLEIRPWALTDGYDRDLAQLPHLSFEALTSFFIIRIDGEIEGQPATSSFVINLPLHGAPADRRDRLLRTVLHNRADVLRYLRVLLADSGWETGELVWRKSDGPIHPGGGEHYTIDIPLFEALMHTLYRNPVRLDEIARLVKNLQHGDNGESLLPEGFNSIWKPIWSMRERGEV